MDELGERILNVITGAVTTNMSYPKGLTWEQAVNEILSLEPLATLIHLLGQTREDCPKCEGIGEVLQSADGIHSYEATCPKCNGTGKTYDISRLVVLDADQSYPDMVFYCPTCKKMVKNTRCNIVDSGWAKVRKVKGV